MAIHFKVLAFILLLSFTISPATAAEKWGSLVISTGRSKAQNDCSSPLLAFITAPSCSESHSAYRLAYDYSITPMWGLEISYGDLGDAEGAGPFIAGGAPATWSMKSIGWAFVGTGTFPLGNGFSLLGKIGGVRAEFREKLNFSLAGTPYHATGYNGTGIISSAKNGLTYGLGVQYDFNDTYALRAQYESFGKYAVYDQYGITSPQISLSMLSAGLVLKF